MNISKSNRKIISNEFKYVLKKMKETPNPQLKNYYFSATYGVIGRIKRQDYDPQLVFIEAILSSTYNSLFTLSDRYSHGATTPPPPEGNFVEPLEKILKRLTEKIEQEKDNDIYKILEAMICYIYSLSGPGYFDGEKGIKIIPKFE